MEAFESLVWGGGLGGFGGAGGIARHGGGLVDACEVSGFEECYGSVVAHSAGREFMKDEGGRECGNVMFTVSCVDLHFPSLHPSPRSGAPGDNAEITWTSRFFNAGTQVLIPFL